MSAREILNYITAHRKTIAVDTLKIAAACMCAVLAADALGLEFYLSAGIIAILSIQPTKKETIRTAAGRFLAFICAVLIALASFTLLGYNLGGFAVYIVCFIAVCLCFKWNSAMAMDSVLITHFLSVGNMGPRMILNEFLIFCIGTLAGIAVNSSLKKDTARVEKLKDDADSQIRSILYRMSERIVTRDVTDYNGHCFSVLWDDLRKAQNMAETNYMNVYATDDLYDVKYLEMRNDQCHVLYEMYKTVRRLNTTPVQARKISAFLRKVSEEYHKDNTVAGLIEDLSQLSLAMKNEPMPVNRAEFEDRARLFTLISLLEEFLDIKKQFMQQYGGRNPAV